MFTKFMRLKELFSGRSTETDYAEAIAENIQKIDEHDHQTSGAPIPIDAVNINNDVNLRENKLTRASLLNIQIPVDSAQLIDSDIPNNSFYLQSDGASDTESLYWKNSEGNPVRITNDAFLAGVSDGNNDVNTLAFTDVNIFTDENGKRILRLTRATGDPIDEPIPDPVVAGVDKAFIGANWDFPAEGPNAGKRILSFILNDGEGTKYSPPIVMPDFLNDPALIKDIEIVDDAEDNDDAPLKGKRLRITTFDGAVKLGDKFPKPFKDDYTNITWSEASRTLTLVKRDPDAPNQSFTIKDTTIGDDDIISGALLSDDTLRLQKRKSTLKVDVDLSPLRTNTRTTTPAPTNRFTGATWTESTRTLSLTRASGTNPVNLVIPENTDAFESFSVTSSGSKHTKRTAITMRTGAGRGTSMFLPQMDAVGTLVDDVGIDQEGSGPTAKFWLTTRKYDGTATRQPFPDSEERLNDVVNVEVTAGTDTLKFIRADGSSFDRSLRSLLSKYRESDNDYVAGSWDVRNKQLVLDRRSHTPRNPNQTRINIPIPDAQGLPSKHYVRSQGFGGDYPSERNAVINYKTSTRDYTFQATASTAGNLRAASVKLPNSRGNRATTLRGGNTARDQTITLPQSLPTVKAPMFMSPNGTITNDRIRGTDIADSSIPLSKIQNVNNLSFGREAIIANLGGRIISVPNTVLGSVPSDSGIPIEGSTLNLKSLRDLNKAARGGIELSANFRYYYVNTSSDGLVNSDLWSIRRFVTYTRNGRRITDDAQIFSAPSITASSHSAGGRAGLQRLSYFVNFNYNDTGFMVNAEDRSRTAGINVESIVYALYWNTISHSRLRGDRGRGVIFHTHTTETAFERRQYSRGSATDPYVLKNVNANAEFKAVVFT